VAVSVEVAASGQVAKAEALSGHPLLRDGAVEAARRWLFRQASGPRTIVLTFSFKIYPTEAERGGVVSVFKTPLEVEMKEITPPPMID
jgi:hypothetical protein